MHAAALSYVEGQVAKLGPFLRVAEFGSLDVNGSVRGFFGEAFYLGIDLKPGPGVDVVADALEVPLEGFDCVVSTEVFEHYPQPQRLVHKAYRSLVPGGVFIATMAGPDRSPHGADGGHVRPGEWYANIGPDALREWLRVAGFGEFDVESTGDDVRCWAIR